MKLELNNLLRKDEGLDWTPERLLDNLRATILEIIRLELEGLPREEWEKTLIIWVKICAFCRDMMKRKREEREDFYRRFNFDSSMVHISESLIEKLILAQNLGLLIQGERPEKILKLALENYKEDSEELEFMKNFFKGLK